MKTFGWRGAFQIILLKTEEREDINKHACRLLSDSELFDNMAINFGCTSARLITSLALARGVTWWAFALNLAGLCPKLEHLAGLLLMWQNIE